VNPVTPVGANVPASTAQGTTSTSPAAASPSSPSSLLSEHTFLELLVDQLKYQDPLSPMSGAQFMSQVAQLSEVETMQQLAQDVSASSRATELSSATRMIGTQVQAITSTGAEVSGTVSAVKLVEGAPQLVVDGTTIPLSDLAEVQPAGTSSTVPSSGSTSPSATSTSPSTTSTTQTTTA
jgi:flagellar basal-body rod modification protein FlgD